MNKYNDGRSMASKSSMKGFLTLSFHLSYISAMVSSICLSARVFMLLLSIPFLFDHVQLLAQDIDKTITNSRSKGFCTHYGVR